MRARAQRAPPLAARADATGAAPPGDSSSVHLSPASTAPSVATSAPAAVASIDSTLSMPNPGVPPTTSRAPTTVTPATPAAATAIAATAPHAGTRPASAERAPVASTSAGETASGEPPETAASLFERASTARRQGRAGEAMALYQQLQTRFGASGEARLTVALLARMHLDRGDASAALAGYEAYLRSGHGALREEAMAGRALALGRLGQSSSEQAAWAALLAAFPRTSYAALAAKRMGTTP